MTKAEKSSEDLSSADWSKILARTNMMIYEYFYIHQKQFVTNEIAEIVKEIASKELCLKERKDLRGKLYLFKQAFAHYVNTSFFLMMYSHFEERLGAICKVCSGSIPTRGKEQGLGRFKKHFRDKHGVVLSDNPHWEFINDAAKIRHILLHCCGFIPLIPENKREWVNKLIKRKNALVGVVDGRVVPREELIAKFNREMPAFADWLTDVLSTSCKN